MTGADQVDDARTVGHQTVRLQQAVFFADHPTGRLFAGFNQ
jgi:hypothetical protein